MLDCIHMIKTGVLIALIAGGPVLLCQDPQQPSPPPQQPPAKQEPDKPPKPKPDEEKSSWPRDPDSIADEMLTRAEINNRESERQKAVTASKDIVKLAQQLKDNLAGGTRFDMTAKLEDIEKLAKRIRSFSGGSETADGLEDPPTDMAAGLDFIIDLGEQLHQELEKRHRNVISVHSIDKADTIIRLARYLRQQAPGAEEPGSRGAVLSRQSLVVRRGAATNNQRPTTNDQRPTPRLRVPLFALSSFQQKNTPESQEPLSLASNLVLLNVTVTDRHGNFAPELNKSDFTLLEDGAPQPIEYFGSESTPFAVAILLDVSGSMERMSRIATAAARNFADKLRGEDVMGVYVFADKVAKVQDYGTDPDLDESIWQIRPEGYTALYDAITMAAEDLSQRPERRRAILVLSDGADTRSAHSLGHCLTAALNGSVTIYAVYLMDPNYARQTGQAGAILKSLVEKTGGRYITDPGGTEMYRGFAEVVQELSHQYTIGYFPSLEKFDGKWHTLEVRLSKTDLQARTRQGYRAPKRK